MLQIEKLFREQTFNFIRCEGGKYLAHFEHKAHRLGEPIIPFKHRTLGERGVKSVQVMHFYIWNYSFHGQAFVACGRGVNVWYFEAFEGLNGQLSDVRLTVVHDKYMWCAPVWFRLVEHAHQLYDVANEGSLVAGPTVKKIVIPLNSLRYVRAGPLFF